MAYNPVTWTDSEDITVEKLNQMAANIDELYRRSVTVSGEWDGADPAPGQPVKIWFTNARFSPNKQKTNSVWVPFPAGFFSPGTAPIVVVSMARRQRNRIWLAVKGAGANNNWPDPDGVEIHGIIDPKADYTFDVYEGINVVAIGK